MEILTVLITAAGPVRPAALATKLMADRSTVSRNLALMQKRGWVNVAEISPTGRAMSVTITGTGVAAFTSASTAWRSAQTSAARMLGPAATSVLDQWLDLHTEIASGSDADNSRPTELHSVWRITIRVRNALYSQNRTSPVAHGSAAVPDARSRAHR